MDTNAVNIQGVALNPKGDGRNRQGDSGQRQASRQHAAPAGPESPQSEPSGDDAMTAIAENLGHTLGHYLDDHHLDLSA